MTISNYKYLLKKFIFAKGKIRARHDYMVFQKELSLIKKYSDININEDPKILIFGCMKV